MKMVDELSAVRAVPRGGMRQTLWPESFDAHKKDYNKKKPTSEFRKLAFIYIILTFYHCSRYLLGGMPSISLNTREK